MDTTEFNALQETIERAILNHPCKTCSKDYYCKINKTACKEFSKGLTKGFGVLPSDFNPKPNYKYFVAAFIDGGQCSIEKGVSKVHYVWERGGYAGAFSCDKTLNPNEALGSHYIIHEASNKNAAFRLELALNVMESMDSDHKVRAVLDDYSCYTSGEISALTSMPRKAISKELKRLAVIGITKQISKRPCKIMGNDVLVTTWQLM